MSTVFFFATLLTLFACNGQDVGTSSKSVVISESERALEPSVEPARKDTIASTSPQPLASDGVSIVWAFDSSTPRGTSVDQSDFTETTRGTVLSAIEEAPMPLQGQGLRITSTNRSDDQWVFITRVLTKTDGIIAGQRYLAKLTLYAASNTASGCFGVGGSPDAVTLKGGVVNRRPIAVHQPKTGYIGFNIKKGNQMEIGQEAMDLGNIGNGSSDCSGLAKWTDLTPRSGEMVATATSEGNLWIYVGTDSGFESTSTLLYRAITVELSPQR